MIWGHQKRSGDGPTTRRSRLRTALATLAAVLPVVSVLAVTAPASAHANSVTGVASCQADGTYTVTWTVANDYKYAVDVTLNDTSGNTPKKPDSSGGGTLAGLPAHLGAYGSTTVTQSSIPGSTTSARLTVTGIWTDTYTQADTGTVTFHGSCLPNHTAAVPTATQPSCDVLTGSITVPSDEGVVYKVDGKTKTGTVAGLSLGDHTVTASSTTLKLVGPKYWKFTFVPTTADCRTKIDIPAAPVPTAPTCSVGGSLTLPSTDGLHYTWSDDKAADAVGDHTLTATADKGYVFSDGATTHTFTVSVLGATNDCAAPLVDPTVTQSVCTGPGTSSDGVITLPASTEIVTYSVKGDDRDRHDAGAVPVHRHDGLGRGRGRPDRDVHRDLHRAPVTASWTRPRSRRR